MRMSPSRLTFASLVISLALLMGCGDRDRFTSPPEPLVSCSYADTVGSNMPSDRMAILVKARAAAYPAAARDRGIEGLVRAQVTIGRSGAVCKAIAVSSDTTGLLEQATIDAVVHWEFEPATRNGVPVSSRLWIPFRFSLN